MDIKFTRKSFDYSAVSSYYDGRVHRICSHVLESFFDLTDKPEEITFHLSKKEHTNSYFVKALKERFHHIEITLSNGYTEIYHVYSGIYAIVNQFPDGCWVSCI